MLGQHFPYWLVFVGCLLVTVSEGILFAVRLQCIFADAWMLLEDFYIGPLKGPIQKI